MQFHDLPRARCWLEVNTGAIAHNLHLAQSLLRPESTLIAVLKADAYGLGIASVGRLLWAQGVRHFAVACLEEAFSLREALPRAWILCMGETLSGALREAVQAEIRLTVGDMDSAGRAAAAARETRKEAFVHCKVDTGLYRIGFSREKAVSSVLRCAELPHVRVEGVYTHLALHNQKEDAAQQAVFEQVLCALRSGGDLPPMAHMLDSIGLVRYPGWQYQAVRVGALLYGNSPRGFDRADQVRPTVRFCARVARVHAVPAGRCVGYDDDHLLPRDTVVATLTAGYGDGYPRALSFCGEVLIRGRRAKSVSLICMDQMMVDVTEIPGVRPGDETVLLGDGITLTEYAAAGRLNRNECTAIIGKRVPRIYV